MRVSVHRNLTTGKWVVSNTKITRNGERKGVKSGDISKGSDIVALENVTFVTCSQVSIERIQRNIKDKSVSAGREVVAYALGDLVDSTHSECLEHVSWNPLKGKEFYLENGQPVTNQTFSCAVFADVMKVRLFK